MKKNDEKIDLLLDRNTSEQLEKVDWGELSSSISKRLNLAIQKNLSKWRFLKAASGLATAAAIIFAVLVFFGDGQSGLVLEDGRTAKVVFSPRKRKFLVDTIEKAKTANVVFAFEKGREGTARVDLVREKQVFARCDVEIQDVKAAKREERTASWIIISRPEPVYADNGDITDEMSMLHLF